MTEYLDPTGGSLSARRSPSGRRSRGMSFSGDLALERKKSRIRSNSRISQASHVSGLSGGSSVHGGGGQVGPVRKYRASVQRMDLSSVENGPESKVTVIPLFLD